MNQLQIFGFKIPTKTGGVWAFSPKSIYIVDRCLATLALFFILMFFKCQTTKMVTGTTRLTQNRF